MKRHIVTISVVIASALSAGEPDPTKFHYGYAAHEAHLATQVVKTTVEILPKVASEVGNQVVEGVFKKFDKEKQKEVAGNLLRGAMDELSSAERQQLAYDWMKGSAEGLGAAAVGGVTMAAGAASAKVTAAATATKVAVTAKASAAAAGTKATIAAGLASPAAPFVIGGVVIAGTVGGGSYGAYKYREGNFRRCLNTNFGGNLNEEGFPQRCESPARRLSWWSQYTRDTMVGHYKVEREGLVKKGSERES